MATPQFTCDLPESVFLWRSGDGGLTLSEGLVDLLRNHREKYAWPFENTAAKSQQEIIDIECAVCERTNPLTVEAAHQIVIRVSEWAGNRRHGLVVGANKGKRVVMYESIRGLLDEVNITEGLENLSNTPGISLVIATKVFRFCRPMAGAAVDRHASYFFNSLPVRSDETPLTRSTRFRRQWKDRDQDESRISTFYSKAFKDNLFMYAATYMPILREIATALNAAGVQFTCAATGIQKTWTPADVEMAAFYWWALNGSR